MLSATPIRFPESLVKATPILLCALAVILPARLGLITVGGEGQLYFGALTGTAVVVNFPEGPIFLLLPMTLAAGALGGALWERRGKVCCVPVATDQRKPSRRS